jgi:hypothetical protein
VGADSPKVAAALTERHPALRFVVQMKETAFTVANVAMLSDAAERITLKRREPGEPQTLQDATLYMLRMSACHSQATRALVEELHAHLDVLRANSEAALLLAPLVLPEAGSVDQRVEALARLRDLTLLQLANERELDIDELIELVNSVHDNTGGLVVVKQLRSPNSSTVAVVIKYQMMLNGNDGAQPSVLTFV